MEKKEEILRVRNLDISFETTAGVVNAVRGVNLTVNRGETVAIVGESGSGKSVSAKAIMGILAKNGTIDRGQITFSYYRNPEERVTREILQMKKEEIRRHINGKRIAMVFQDPMTSLNPLMPVGKQIMEGMIWHYHTPKEEAYEKALELMKLVGITDKHHLTPVFQSIEQMPCQIDVQHRDLVHQNKIRVQHFRCAILSIITSEDSQRFVDRG